MKKACKLGIIAGIIGVGFIVKKAFDCGFRTANEIDSEITNDVIKKYNSLLDDYENLESDYYELLEE
ncbi:MAG: hypothetical protein NC177_14050 [Ruminococcus flavefaciens]|nr:hypothetical protein [Ruminococcus flavefaciens]